MSSFSCLAQTSCIGTIPGQHVLAGKGYHTYFIAVGMAALNGKRFVQQLVADGTGNQASEVRKVRFEDWGELQRED